MMVHNPDASTDSRRPPKQWTLAQKWRAVSINNKLIVIFSCITTFATVIYSGFAGWQLFEIHSGAKDTHDLAVAAKTQAAKAETISTSITQAVTELTSTADATNRSVKAIQSQTRISERPWVQFSTENFYIEEGQPLHGDTHMDNIGKTIAENLRAFIVIDKVRLHETPHFNYPRERGLFLSRLGLFFLTSQKIIHFSCRDGLKGAVLQCKNTN